MNAVEKVPFFTPVISKTTDCFPNVLLYLQPFGGRVAVECDRSKGPGEIGCLEKIRTVKWYETALVIGSYVLSCGILPLLVLYINCLVRCVNQYYWIKSEHADIDLELKGRLSTISAYARLDTSTQEQVRSVFEEILVAERAIPDAGQSSSEEPRPRFATLQDLRGTERRPAPAPVPLHRRPGGHRLGTN
jgi:hypothetical protein